MMSEYELSVKSLAGDGGVGLHDENTKHQEVYFKKFDQLLDASSHGDQWLRRPEIAKIVSNSLHCYDGIRYDLICYTIMPNHVHLVIDHNLSITDAPLEKILQSVKKYTARKANSVLNRRGISFWQSESYDHIIRTDQEYENTVRYVIYNPVSANLCKDWMEWRWTYLKKEFISFFT